MQDPEECDDDECAHAQDDCIQTADEDDCVSSDVNERGDHDDNDERQHDEVFLKKISQKVQSRFKDEEVYDARALEGNSVNEKHKAHYECSDTELSTISLTVVLSDSRSKCKMSNMIAHCSFGCKVQ